MQGVNCNDIQFNIAAQLQCKSNLCIVMNVIMMIVHPFRVSLNDS